MNNAQPTVAVIIPTYNRWPLVVRAVESVLAQSHPATQCVVVDDASTDNTPALLREKFGARITLIEQPRNLEKSATRNAGVRAVDADYVCFLDSDDELVPDAVAQRLEIFRCAPGFDGVAYGFSTGALRPEELQALLKSPPEGDVLAAYLHQYFVNNNGFMLSRANMMRHGMYQEMLTHREDRELLIRLAAQLEFRCTRTVVTHVHRTPGSARFDYDKARTQGLEMVRRLHANPVIAAKLGAHLDAIEQAEHWEWLRCLYKAGEYREFRRALAGSWPFIRTASDRRKLARRWFTSFWRQWTSAPLGAGRRERDARIHRASAETSSQA